MLLDDNSSAFIVRIWLEHREIAGTPVTWRGSIEHVASGRVKYLAHLNELAQFIRPYLEAMSASLSVPVEEG